VPFPKRRAIAASIVLGILGCQATPVTAPAPTVGGGGGPVAPSPTPTPPLPSGNVLERELTVDVDPLQGSASLHGVRAAQAVVGVLEAQVGFPEVTHQPDLGLTTVTVEVRNGQQALGLLELRVGGDRRLVGGEAVLHPKALAPGQADRVALTFENPGGGPFQLQLTLAGVAAAPSPSPSPVVTPTPAPTPTETPTPTPTPTLPPAGGGSGSSGSGGGGVVYTSTPTPTEAPTPSPTPTATPTATPTPAPSPTPTATPTPTPDPGATGTPTPAPTATPTPMPAPSGGLLLDFEDVALNAAPTDFIDPNDEGYSYAWMPRVTWKVVSLNGSRQFEHDGLSNTGNLSFRRYKGTGLGTSNGELPAKYMAELDVTPIQSNTYSPTGDQGTQVYYLDPTHYVEVLIKPTMFEVWQCDGGVPFTSAGWTRLYFSDATTTAGQTRHLGAQIDCTTHQLKAYFDGQLMTTLTIPLLTNQPHYLALRGTGNVVAHDNVRVKPL
jgi:hypothetical protein